MDKTITDILTNSIGAVAVTVVFLWYIDRQDTRNTDLIEKHFASSNKMINKLSNAVTKLTVAIAHLREIIKDRK